MTSNVPMRDDDPINLNLARTFRRVGRFGFWLQIVIGAIPIVIGVLVLSRATILPGGRFAVIGYFALFSLLILVFTTLWFLRYARLARHIEQKDGKWTHRRLTRAVAIGLGASSAGILFSTVVMIVEVSYLLIIFLEMPQGGLPVIQTSADHASWVSAIDALSLMALVLMVAAEVIVLVLGLWLLHRVTTATAEHEKTSEPLPATS